ncbi:hypothetical protein [Roseofilum casamattae]|uniref:Uncharacterized protein n=1 Tax=Roseofilum casamattae BLCC-M143 TaxID=3022442 RepID=A0ABT7BXW2_9CYAN|nr:hypothetical protein [Roseofilum casamattae]MDJ1184037.1 hypothetical protein [Roseofilum casamattae BLCC-M143]
MSNSQPTSYTTLSDRSQYQHCRITVPDLERPIAAIKFQDRYYSLFRVVADPKRADILAQRLAERGDAVILTATAKGSAIWVEEANASPVSSTKSKSDKPAPPSGVTSTASNLPYQIITSSNLYQKGTIRVPDLNDPLQGIEFEQQHYSLFQSFSDWQRASDIALRLAEKGDRIVILADSPQYSLWILEPEAKWIA